MSGQEESGGGDGRGKKRRKIDEVTHVTTDAVQYHCDYCRKDISNTVRISCAECQEFDLCVECFSVGVELGKHKNDHDFRIIDNMHFPFLTDDWGADEEQLLLEGLEIYGFGNWEDVAEHITTKTKRECEEHYNKYYLNSPFKPLPDLRVTLTKREDVLKLNSGIGIMGNRREEQIGSTPGKKQTKSAPKPQPSHPVKPEYANFMPARGEFEIEWDNEAEQVIKDLEFDDLDTKDEKDVKVKLIEIYNKKLDDREEKRRFVIERNLHDVKKMSAIEKKRTKEEKDSYTRTRKFATILTGEEYENFVRNLILEKQLRQRIIELQTFRLNGIRSFNDADQFKKEQKRREMEKQQQRRGMSSRGRWPDPMEKQTKKAGFKLESTFKPGQELLSEIEKEVCSTLRLLPDQYLSVKENLIREFLTNGELRKDKAIAIAKIEPIKASKLFDFLVELGWIKNSNTNTQTPVAANTNAAVQQQTSSYSQPVHSYPQPGTSMMTPAGYGVSSSYHPAHTGHMMANTNSMHR